MEARYQVSGMTCQHCVNHVLAEVNSIPGVEKTELNLEGTLIIHSETEIDFDRIVEAVAEAGDYEVE